VQTINASESRELFAVIGSPDSRIPVRAPENRDLARRLKAANRFYCSSALGGCGGELTFAIGDVNVPHFRHHSGVRCALLSSNETRDRYTHLAIQEALRTWIETTLGLVCRLEVAIESGRTDILVSGPDFEVALEVQRSPLSALRAGERTNLYGGRADTVQWLFARKDIDAHKTELADQGWSLRVWWGWSAKECRIGVSYRCGDDVVAETKDIGGPLTDWNITAFGLESAHLQSARESAHQRRLLEQDRAQQEAAEAARIHDQKEARDAEARRRYSQKQQATRDALRKQLIPLPESTDGIWPTTWPDLRGSEKQRAWAESIRSELVSALREELGQGFLTREIVRLIAHWLAQQTAAQFWIRNKDSEPIDIINHYEHDFDPSGLARQSWQYQRSTETVLQANAHGSASAEGAGGDDGLF
jgi:hypothetical protein